MSGTPSTDKETTTPLNGGDAYLRSLSSVAQGAADKPTQMRAGVPVQPVKGKRRGKGKGRPWTNIRAIVQENAEVAVKTLAHLTTSSDNDCVRYGASKALLRVLRDVSPDPKTGKRESGDRELRVTIKRFKKE